MVHRYENKFQESGLSSRVFPIILLLLGLIIVWSPVQALAQGTALKIEDVSLTSGDTTTLYLQLTEALDGLGRIDATIVSSNPEVLKLKSITPEAVSKQFLQVDSKTDSSIKFKLVDLGKKVRPGDTNVQLVSFEVKAVKAGKAEINVKGIKYTDEDGNVIKPKVNGATVKVSSTSQKVKKKTTEKTNASSQKKASSEATKKEKSPKTGEAKKKEGEAETKKAAKDTYVPEIGGLELRLGDKGKLGINLSSLSRGLQRVKVSAVSGDGVSLNGVVPLNPTYSEVVRLTKKMIGFRMGDFDGNVQPGTTKLKLAKLRLEGIEVGTTRIRLKLTLWTDEGEKIVRTTRSGPIKVEMGTIGDAEKPPEDPDGDGLYEDVNGDGQLNQKDPFALAFNLGTESVMNSASLFDFNWDGKVTFDDAVELMREIEQS